jgi:hypothetical protein
MILTKLVTFEFRVDDLQPAQFAACKLVSRSRSLLQPVLLLLHSFANIHPGQWERARGVQFTATRNWHVFQSWYMFQLSTDDPQETGTCLSFVWTIFNLRKPVLHLPHSLESIRCRVIHWLSQASLCLVIIHIYLRYHARF